MTKRDARALGYRTGYDIARQNFDDAAKAFIQEQGERGKIEAGQKDALIDHVVSVATETESEHYRQAQEFNESRDPDGMWAAYEDGVYKGAVAAARKEAADPW